MMHYTLSTTVCFCTPCQGASFPSKTDSFLWDYGPDTLACKARPSFDRCGTSLSVSLSLSLSSHACKVRPRRRNEMRIPVARRLGCARGAKQRMCLRALDLNVVASDGCSSAQHDSRAQSHVKTAATVKLRFCWNSCSARLSHCHTVTAAIPLWLAELYTRLRLPYLVFCLTFSC